MSGQRMIRALAAFAAGAAFGFGLWLAGSSDLPKQKLDLALDRKGVSARPAEVRIERPFALPPRTAGDWLASEAEFRQTVELGLVPAASPGTGGVAEARLHLGLTEPLAGARVYDATGAEVASRLEPLGDTGDYCLLFAPETMAAGERFNVYYPAAPALPLEGVETGVEVTVFPGLIRQTRRLTTPAEFDAELAALGSAGHPIRQPSIDGRRSPYGPDSGYVAVYQGWLACVDGGRYELGMDASDEASVFVNGQRVLTGGMSSGVPQQDFPVRGSVELQPGLHEVAVYHVQGSGSLRMRLGWRPPGSASLRTIPPSALRGLAVARPVAIETRDDEGSPPFFEARPVRRMIVNRKVPLEFFELVARLPQGEYDAAWREEDGPLREDARSSERLEIAVSGLRSTGGRRRVTLELSRDGRRVASYTRDVAVSSVPEGESAEPLALRFDVSAETPFVYEREQVTLSLTAVNGSRAPIPLEVRERPSGGESALLERFVLPGVPARGKDDIASRTRSVPRSFDAEKALAIRRLSLAIGPPGAPVVERDVVFLGSREELLPNLSVAGGRAATADGALAVFVLPHDTEADLRRFAGVRALPSGIADKRLGLLLGDCLASPGAERGEGLLPGMKAALGRMRIEHRAFPEGDPPVLAAACAAGGAFMEEDWGTIWISPGIADVRHGTTLQVYERGLGFIIDRARRLRPDARLVMIGPPPEWLRTDASSRYAETAERVARFRGVEYVDLHGLIMQRDPRGSAWTEGGGSAGFPHPVGPALDAIVRAVVGR